MIDALALAWSSVVSAVSLVAAARSLGRRPLPLAVRPGQPGAGRTVLLVRPCAGDEPRLLEALASSIEAACAVGARVVVAIASPDDGAAAAADRAVAAMRERGVEAELVVTGPSPANAKSGQLAAVLAGQSADVVVVADSDVVLRPDDLRRLLDGLDGQGGQGGQQVAATWMPPAEVAAPLTLGDRASQAVLSGSLHAFPLLAGIDGGGMVGKLFAVRRTALEAAGGFGSLTDVLGEDMELSRRLRALGLSVAAVSGVARSVACGRSPGATLDRYARWLLVIRGQRPWLMPSYPLLFAALPLLALLSASALPSRLALASLALAAGSRIAVAAAARRLVAGRFQPVTLLVDIMLADSLLLAAFAKSLARRTLVWRGRTLSLGSGGRLELSPAGRAARLLAPLLLVLALGSADALALPAVGQPGKNVALEDASGKVIEMAELMGKPILLVYEDKSSAHQNQPFKDELAKLAKGDKYKQSVSLAAVADLSAYNYWPVKGFVKDAIKKESKKVGTTIFCDWTGQVRDAYTFKKATSSVVLMDRLGKVLFSVEGPMTPEQRKQAIGILRSQVEGDG